MYGGGYDFLRDLRIEYQKIHILKLFFYLELITTDLKDIKSEMKLLIKIRYLNYLQKTKLSQKQSELILASLLKIHID